MKVKDLRTELIYTDDEDEVVVSYPDLGTGGMRETNDVKIATERSKMTVMADEI